MKRLYKIFISAPIARDPNYKGRFFNMERQLKQHFAKSELYESLSLRVINPVMEIVNGERAHYIRESLKLLADCDAVVFADDYETAPGCVLEYNNAKEMGLTIVMESELYSGEYILA